MGSPSDHGFLLRHSQFTDLTVPGATSTMALGVNNGNLTTTINGVNDFGQLVGFYVDSAGNTDGFLATPQH